MSRSLHRRVQEIKARQTIRAWELRQNDCSKGVWFRLRRMLADVHSVYAVSEQTVQKLLAEDYASEQVGRELEPTKELIFIDESRLQQIPERRALAVRLDAAFLTERFLVLICFPGLHLPLDEGWWKERKRN